MGGDDRVEPNDLLKQARARMLSPSGSGRSMSRGELAEAVNAFLWTNTGERYELDARVIGRQERGEVRWPAEAIRMALRHILHATTDAELGFHTGQRATAATSMRPGTVDPGIPVDAVLAAAADESAGLLARAELTGVGELTVEQLHADIRRVAGSYLNTPTLPLFTRTRALRDHAFQLLDGRPRPAQARELWAAAGWSCTLLAWMTVDMGQSDLAETHARAAWACARNADHDGLRAWVRATQHTASYWRRDYAKAASYAADGLTYTTGTGTAATFLASAHALDLARVGHAEQARAALTFAQRTAETAQPAPDEIGGPLTCSAARAEGIWADALLTLGDPAATARHAAQAVAQFEATPVEQRNHGSERMARLQLVKARLAMGELDGAAAALDPVLTTAAEHLAQPLMHRLGEVRAAADAYGRERLARRIHVGITELTA